nr:hypothetical protein [Betaproteobacteria bacterium]
ENQTQEPAVTEQLQRSVEALERKNQELIAELRAAKKSPQLPDGVNVDELLEFKRKAEQSQLEQQGNYTEARQALQPSTTRGNRGEISLRFGFSTGFDRKPPIRKLSHRICA